MIWLVAVLVAAVSISLLAVAVGTALDRLGQDYPETRETVLASRVAGQSDEESAA